MNETEKESNRRRRERLHLSLPIRVQCRETLDEGWEEITRLIDVTPFGAGFTLVHEIAVGRLLLLTTPMPRQLRVYDHAEEQYRVWALVRHVRRQTVGNVTTSAIGAAFIGKYPPISYAENPSKIYEVIAPDAIGFWSLREVLPTGAGEQKQADFGIDLRRQSRYQIPMNVTIEVFGANGETVATELTVTEDISLTGASVLTTLNIECGRFVRLSSEQYDVTIVAIVRARKIGKDGVTRLHLEFIDRQFPLEVVE